jgi:hypothetical protein
MGWRSQSNTETNHNTDHVDETQNANTAAAADTAAERCGWTENANTDGEGWEQLWWVMIPLEYWGDDAVKNHVHHQATGAT